MPESFLGHIGLSFGGRIKIQIVILKTDPYSSDLTTHCIGRNDYSLHVPFPSFSCFPCRPYGWKFSVKFSPFYFFAFLSLLSHPFVWLHCLAKQVNAHHRTFAFKLFQSEFYGFELVSLKKSRYLSRAFNLQRLFLHFW